MVGVLALYLLSQLPDVSQATLSGVVVTDFNTPEGLVRVYLPDDLAAGDTISGTVYIEPRGANDGEKTANLKLLQGVSIAIDDDVADVSGTRLVVRGMDKSHRLQRSIRVRVSTDGKMLTAPLSFGDVRTDRVPRFMIPDVSPSGRPVVIVGPFDGDTSNTRVDFGGKEAVVLAETPRGCVVQTDASFVGPQKLVLNEGGQQVERIVVLPRLTLTAPKTTLMRGERTKLTVRVTGLEGLGASAYPIPIELTNRSPLVVSIEGATNFGVDARDVRGGEWSKELSVVASGQGAYVITGLIHAVPLHDAKRAMTPTEFNEWVSSLRVLYADKLKKLEAEAENGRSLVQARIDETKRLLDAVNGMAAVKDAGEQSSAALIVDRLLIGHSLNEVARDLMMLADGMLGYAAVPKADVGKLVRGAAALTKRMPKTRRLMESAEQMLPDLDRAEETASRQLRGVLQQAANSLESER